MTDSLSARVPDVSTYIEKYAGYDGVFVSVDESLEHTGGSNFALGFEWNFFRIRKIRYVVLNPDAQNLTTFTVRLAANHKLRDVYLRCTNPGQPTRYYNVRHLSVEKNSDGSINYKFAYPDVRKGAFIEEGYEIEYTNLLNFPPLDHEVSLQYQIPIEHIKFRYAYPDWWSIQTKGIAATHHLPIQYDHDVKNKKTILRYEAKNVEAVTDEPYSPFFKEMAAYLQLQVTNMTMGELRYQPTLTWEAIGDRVKKYAVDKVGFLDRIFSTTIKNQSKLLTRGASSSVAKLDSIVTWAQNNIVLSTDPKVDDFNKVLRQNKGNAFLITGLTQALLREAGLNAEFLLLHSAADGYLDIGYVSWNQFQTPALSVTIEDQNYIVFPYIKDLHIRHLPEPFQGQKALLIRSQGGHTMITLPTGNADKNSSSEKYDVTIRADGTLEVKEEKTLTGSLAFGARRQLAKMKTEERTEFLKNLLTYTDGEIRIQSNEIIGLDEHRKELRIRLNYTIDNLVTITPNEVLFQTGGLLSPASKIKRKIDPANRKNPIAIYYDETQNKDIVVHFPESWKLTTLLEDKFFDNLFGSVEAKYSVQDGLLSAHEMLHLKPAMEKKDKMKDLLDILGRSSRLEVPTLIFTIKKDTTSGN
jgi:hypothetical protein